MTIDNNKLILDGHKLAWHADRVEAWLAGEKIAPITIDCALTRACNFGCVYCYGKFQENEPTRLTKDLTFRFLDDAAEIGVKAISFVSDGESTCAPFLYDSILRGKENGLDMALGTNGAILRKDRLADILPALTYLRFNMSAGEPERFQYIHGCKPGDFGNVVENVKESVTIKKRNKLEVTIGLQMVLMPEFKDQILPLAKLGKDLGVDYLVIKHCSDTEDRGLGIEYERYKELEETLMQAEKISTEDYAVKVKWSKINAGNKRSYQNCYGPAFIMQFSGSGLVAPCGMLFNNKFKKYHIGNIAEESFKDIWQSNRYQEVLDEIASPRFNAQTMCGTLCLQHKVNEYLNAIKTGEIQVQRGEGKPPAHVNFI